MYTGGPDATVRSVCNIDDGDGWSRYGPKSMLSDVEVIMPNSENLKGNMSLGPVQAGANYSCVVTASNSNGTGPEERLNLTSDIGESSVILCFANSICAS